LCAFETPVPEIEHRVRCATLHPVSPVSEKKCFRFGEFTLSPSCRLLLRGDTEVPLIPRYFDLLHLLIARRNEAVAREEIFDRVWNDVVVSDGALTQAVRSLRRSLGDDAREPRFIRTVSRHGYRFVGSDVLEVEEPPLGATRDPIPDPNAKRESEPVPERELDDALARLAEAAPPTNEEEDLLLLEAAEIVLRSGRDEDVSRLETRELARALLREARWEIEGPMSVPLRGPGALAAAWMLVRLRARRAWKPIRKRWLGSILGGAAAGLVGGFLGGLVLLYGPGSTATGSVLVALPLVGLSVGALGAMGVGGGLSWAEALARSRRGLALAVLGSAGGGLVGGLAHFLGLYVVEGLFGRDLSPVGGGFEGLVLGGAVGIGYALATPVRDGGMAAPRGVSRLRAAAAAGVLAAGAGVALALTGHHLGAMSLDFMARSFPGSQVSLDPLARLLGESPTGPVTRGVISGFEGLGFGLGVVSGLTRRSRER
jgi:DNA-binding winged helix-turn-helix (wHTH) protein